MLDLPVILDDLLALSSRANAIQITAKNNSTRDLSSDLKTWLSAARVNLETCMNGFEGTNNIVKGLVSEGINLLTSQLYNLVSMVKSIPNQPVRNCPRSKYVETYN